MISHPPITTDPEPGNPMHGFPPAVRPATGSPVKPMIIPGGLFWAWGKLRPLARCLLIEAFRLANGRWDMPFRMGRSMLTFRLSSVAFYKSKKALIRAGILSPVYRAETGTLRKRLNLYVQFTKEAQQWLTC